jgi:hypothetical protein
MDKPIYKVRYYVGEWNKPIPEGEEGQEIVPGVKIQPTDIGYADDVVVASVVRDSGGLVESILIMSSENEGASKELLIAVKNAIDHDLAHHLEPDGRVRHRVSFRERKDENYVNF